MFKPKETYLFLQIQKAQEILLEISNNYTSLAEEHFDNLSELQTKVLIEKLISLTATTAYIASAFANRNL